MRTLRLWPLLFCFPNLAGAEVAGDSAAQAQALLAKTRAAYRSAPPFRETLELDVALPGRSPKRTTLEVAVGPAGEPASLVLISDGREIVRLIAGGGQLIGFSMGDTARYAATPFRGDFAAALAQIGGATANLSSTPSLIAALGGDEAAFLQALRFGVLPSLEVIESRALPATAEHGPLSAVTLRGPEAEAVVEIGPEGRFHAIRVEMGRGDYRAAITGVFRFTAGDPGVAMPDLRGKEAVATLTELESRQYPLGQQAPKIQLTGLDGKAVALDFPDSVVIVDFWATWCVPCWTSLEHTRTLAAWARDSGLPIKVFAIDTLEEVHSAAEQRTKVAAFVATRKLDGLPILLDLDRQAFAAFHHPGLPSLVILDRQGRLAVYHSGSIPDMVAAIQAETRRLLETPGH